MQDTYHSVAGSGSPVFMTGRGRARAGVDFLASRWVQAPITDRREADT
ncbi:MAG: hypothetical protein AAF389_19060 [Gemmatimonadota bacterium]